MRVVVDEGRGDGDESWRRGVNEVPRGADGPWDGIMPLDGMSDSTRGSHTDGWPRSALECIHEAPP